MKDIDFDELDRAVGSVLGTDTAVAQKDDDAASDAQTARQDTAQPADDPVVAVEPATSATDEQSPAGLAKVTDASESDKDSKTDVVEEVGNGSVDNVSEKSPVIKPSVSPARKRGQFLDMVHPSANMRTKPATMPTTSRKTLTPLNSVTAGDKPESVSTPTPPADEALTSAAPEPVVPAVVSEPAAANEQGEAVTTPEPTKEETTSWPDPLDFVAKEDDQPGDAADPLGTTDQEADATDATESSQTPFVTDAKVDKRPLGAFAGSDEASSAGGEDPSQPKAEEEAPAPEFDAAVNTIEAAGVPQTDNPMTQTEEPEDESKPAQQSEDTSEPESQVALQPAVEPVKTEEVAPVLTSTSAAATPVASSIHQQYKAPVPKKDDDVDHPLFDTKEYHQPLLPDGKKAKKKPVFIIVLLLILFIIGGALGYIAYTAGL